MYEQCNNVHCFLDLNHYQIEVMQFLSNLLKYWKKRCQNNRNTTKTHFLDPKCINSIRIQVNSIPIDQISSLRYFRAIILIYFERGQWWRMFLFQGRRLSGRRNGNRLRKYGMHGKGRRYKCRSQYLRTSSPCWYNGSYDRTQYRHESWRRTWVYLLLLLSYEH